MKNLLIIAALTLAAGALPQRAWADDDQPEVDPKMIVTGDDYEAEELTEYSGNAPMTAQFQANPSNLGDWTGYYEWRFTESGAEEPFLIRYDQDTEYTFLESGDYSVELIATFVLNGDTIEYEMDSPFTIGISESVLDFPNAFTPNGDGINDVFKAKDGYQSIVEFKACIITRWGKKVCEWTDPADGWDGKIGGKDAPVGGYYLNAWAKGADGRTYKFKRVINLLRNYDETSSSAIE